MAITATLTVTPAAPDHGDVVTATYAVQGNDATAPKSAVVSGDATVGEQNLEVSTVLTLPGTFALPETFSLPTCPDLTFEADADDPHVFTALVP
jgi:hypothetical protein